MAKSCPKCGAKLHLSGTKPGAITACACGMRFRIKPKGVQNVLPPQSKHCPGEIADGEVSSPGSEITISVEALRRYRLWRMWGPWMLVAVGLLVAYAGLFADEERSWASFGVGLVITIVSSAFAIKFTFTKIDWEAYYRQSAAAAWAADRAAAQERRRREQRERSERSERLQKTLFGSDFTQTKYLPGAGIAIDERRGKVCFYIENRLGGPSEPRIYYYEDIVSAELREDVREESTASTGNQLKRAAVGGLLFGGIGAVVGAVSGKRSVNELVRGIRLLVVIRDTDYPLHAVEFLPLEAKRDSLCYQNARQTAETWHALMCAIAAKGVSHGQSASPQAGTSQATLGDGI